MNLATISAALARGDDGVWRPRDAERAAVSFPESGHGECFAIEDASFWFSHRNDLLACALKRHDVEGPFLDIGGGNGVVSKRLAEEGLEVVLIEPGPEGARNGRARGLESVICATLDQAAFEPGSFGSAGLLDVIEHVEDDGALLASAHRVLRPGALLAVTVPAYGWLWSAEDELAGHFRRYDMPRLRAALEAAGFRVEYTTYFFAALTAPFFMLRSLPHRLGRKSRSVEEVESAAAKQHTPGALSRRAMDMLLRPELAAVAAGRALPFGTSLLAIARRP